MSLPLLLLALVPGLALVGPLLIGRHFGADWVLRVSLGFDVIAMILGVGSLLYVRGWAELGGVGAAGTVGGTVLEYLGGGLLGFGALFGLLSARYLFGSEEV